MSFVKAQQCVSVDLNGVMGRETVQMGLMRPHVYTCVQSQVCLMTGIVHQKIKKDLLTRDVSTERHRKRMSHSTEPLKGYG